MPGGRIPPCGMELRSSFVLEMLVVSFSTKYDNFMYEIAEIFQSLKLKAKVQKGHFLFDISFFHKKLK